MYRGKSNTLQLLFSPRVSSRCNVEQFNQICLFQLYEVQAKHQIRVQQGDVIGIHHSKKLAKRQKHGVVAYENQLQEVSVFCLP